MKKILSSLFAVVLFIGCTTSHPKSSVVAPAVLRTAPVAPVAVVQAPAPVTNTVPEASSDLAVLHQSYQTSPTPVTNVVSAPARAATVKDSSTATPLPAVSSPKATPDVAAPSKSHSLIFWLATTVLAVPLTWLAKKYGLPLFKKLLAWIKRKNVVADLKSLAGEAETKLTVDFKDVESDAKSVAAKVEAEFSKVPVTPAPVAAPAVHPVVPAVEVKKA